MRSMLNRLRRSDDGIAMLTALLLIMIVTAVAVAVSGLLISETRPTQNANKSQRTLAAATAGFDAALNKIRAANDGVGNGIRVDLPCTVNNANAATLTGNVSQDSGAATYAVRVRYYQQDPTNRTNTWLDSTSNMVTCTSGYPASVPVYAYIESTGRGTDLQGAKANSGNRTLRTVYQLHTTNSNVAGGRLGVNSTSLCLDVGTTNPTTTTVLLAKTCQVLGTPAQQFTYTTDMQLEWTGSANSNLCLEAAATSGTVMKLNTCAARPTTSPWTNSAWAIQGWGYDDNGRFQGTDTGNGGWNGLCFGPVSATDGAQITVQGCSGATTQWNSDPSVGSGEAGATYNNLVNYQEFARCLDITHQDINAGWIIDYPCKQKANTATFTWNQIFAYNTTTGAITTNAPAGTACLTPTTGTAQGSAASTTAIPTSGNLVIAVTASCSASAAVGAAQRWTETLDTGTYSTSYNIKNTISGLCLAIEQPGFGGAPDPLWGRIVVETCDGSLKQKWNAPPNLISQPLKGTSEGTGGQ